MVVNWSDLARRHNIQNTKGESSQEWGQIAQEWFKVGGGGGGGGNFYQV